jgi:hypothetical protein
LLEKAPRNAKITTNCKIEEEIENQYKVKEILVIKKISRKPYYLIKKLEKGNLIRQTEPVIQQYVAQRSANHRGKLASFGRYSGVDRDMIGIIGCAERPGVLACSSSSEQEIVTLVAREWKSPTFRR